MQKFKLLALGALAAITLSGCFATTDLDRAAVGAAAGGVGAVVLGGSVVTAVVAGAAVGALCDEVLEVCR